MPSALDILMRGLPEAANAVASGDAVAALTALGRGSIGRVEIRSQFTPPTVVNDPLAPGQAGQEPSLLMRLLKPEARVYDPEGNLLVAVAPAGEPTENYLPYLVVGATVIVVGSWVLGSWLISRVSR